MSAERAPVPAPGIDLLAPLLESAGAVLLDLEVDDVPLALRPLRSFDRRSLARGPALEQLRRAIDSAPGFAGTAIEHFTGRDDVQATLAGWSVAGAGDRADEARARGDLALLASVLWAVRPEGWEYGLGAVEAAAAAERRSRGDHAQADDLAKRVDVLDEARRRSDAARLEAEARREEAVAELREERGARRAALDAAQADLAAARRDVGERDSELARLRSELEGARRRHQGEAERARRLEQEVARLRVDLEAAAAPPTDRSPEPARVRGLDPADARALADTGDAARRLTGALDALVARLAPERLVAPAPPRRADRTEVREAAPTRRPSPLPPGLVADTPEGAAAMLRTDGVVLVVDGYNVAKRAWGHVPTPTELRERLVTLLARLRDDAGCEVVVVFDGDASPAPAALRRRGLRVVFSAGDEEADDVVVREVAERPRRVPVVVASSDGWVRDHAASEGAEVVGADTLVAVLRPAGR